MAFVCPECHRPRLRIADRLELGSDSRSDDVSVQTVQCGGCRFEAIAIYEESRRGALDSEHFSHIGYRISPDGLNSLKSALQGCRNRRNSRCNCATHRALRRADRREREDALPGVHWDQPFPMDIAPRR